MLRFFFFFLLPLFTLNTVAQELNCSITINAQQTAKEDVPVFKTLEKQLNEFVNNTRWTDNKFAQHERIESSMFINITKYDGDRFEASIQIQSTRPVYNSSYATTVYNFNDRQFNFNYLEYQRLVYNPSQYESNLVSVISFHVYMILGMDADTFKPNGGDPYFKQALNILNYTQQFSRIGWEPAQNGDLTRSALIDQLTSPTYKDLRGLMYNYHRKGMDYMSDNQKKAKSQLVSYLLTLGNLHKRRPNSFIVRVFFDAKAEEISEVFSSGPSVNIAELVSMLSKVAPMHSSKWSTIRF